MAKSKKSKGHNIRKRLKKLDYFRSWATFVFIEITKFKEKNLFL